MTRYAFIACLAPGSCLGQKINHKDSPGNKFSMAKKYVRQDASRRSGSCSERISCHRGPKFGVAARSRATTRERPGIVESLPAPRPPTRPAFPERAARHAPSPCPARAVLPRGPHLVCAGPRRAHPHPAARLGCHRGRQERPGHRAHGFGQDAGAVLPRGPHLVCAGPRRAHPHPAARLGCHRGRQERPGHRAHGFGQDAGGVSVRHRPPHGGEGRGAAGEALRPLAQGCAGAVCLAAQGPGCRRAAQP